MGSSRRSLRSKRRRDPRQHKIPGRHPRNKYAGGHRIRVTPVPIPNTEVKPDTADGTAWETVWESRSLPAVFTKKGPRFSSGPFSFCAGSDLLPERAPAATSGGGPASVKDVAAGSIYKEGPEVFLGLFFFLCRERPTPGEGACGHERGWGPASVKDVAAGSIYKEGLEVFLGPFFLERHTVQGSRFSVQGAGSWCIVQGAGFSVQEPRTKNPERRTCTLNPER